MYIRFCCFLCEWCSYDRKNHYIRKQWPRENFIPGTKNISHELLVYPKSVFLPPLHIKFNFMKIFVKSLGREGVTFLHLRKIILKNKRGTGKIKVFLLAHKLKQSFMVKSLKINCNKQKNQSDSRLNQCVHVSLEMKKLKTMNILLVTWLNVFV